MAQSTQLFSNNAVSLLAAPISAADVTLTVLPGYGQLFPQPTANQYFLVTLEDQASTIREIIKVTGRSGDTFTGIIRAQEGTIARSWSASSGNDTLVDHRLTAETMRSAMSLPEVPWFFGEETPTVISSGANGVISSISYSSSNRSFKFFITLLNNDDVETFEVTAAINGNLSLNAEVASWIRYGRTGVKLLGQLSIDLNVSTKTMSVFWQNNEATSVTAKCTRIQHSN